MQKNAAKPVDTQFVTSNSYIFCSGLYFIYACTVFKPLDVADRMKKARKFKLCLNYLSRVTMVRCVNHHVEHIA